MQLDSTQLTQNWASCQQQEQQQQQQLRRASECRKGEFRKHGLGFARARQNAKRRIAQRVRFHFWEAPLSHHHVQRMVSLSLYTQKNGNGAQKQQFLFTLSKEFLKCISRYCSSRTHVQIYFHSFFLLVLSWQVLPIAYVNRGYIQLSYGEGAYTYTYLCMLLDAPPRLEMKNG